MTDCETFIKTFVECTINFNVIKTKLKKGIES